MAIPMSEQPGFNGPHERAAEFGASLDYRLGERTRIDAAYDGRFGDGFDEHAGRITLRVAF